ncbi:MAG: type I restriction endonuclease subunit R [Tenericutes bacterium]|nr:type I restriction endonuclease subunit R [Mycoplasmatota bacterium]
MGIFDESTLEQAIIELLQKQNYEYIHGSFVHKELSEVLLLEDFRQYIHSRYFVYSLSDDEIQAITSAVLSIRRKPLYDANKEFLSYLMEGFQLNRKEKDEKDLWIRLIDFDNLDSNIFKIVNQLEIKDKEKRIPDLILYVNGFPLVVFEFKTAIQENTTIHDAYTQLTTRYRRDIPDLFKYNAFVVISDGINNKYGSFFAPYDYFYSWRRIDANSIEFDGINSLYTLIEGLFTKERLLNLIHDFIYFPDSPSTEFKVVCRYPQFFAAKKIHNNILKHMKPNGDGKGGTYFGATGSGKSFTMLFLVRLLMRDKKLNSPTIVLITDRNDLDKQLSELFTDSKKFIGDKDVLKILDREHLKEKLSDRNSGGVYLSTIQKFTENTDLLSERSNIICISDEAHRSQTNINQKIIIDDDGAHKRFGFAKYLHDSLPNATYVGFTGTPIDATLDVFGEVIDSYTMKESVEDGITVNIVYEGRAAKVLLDQEKAKEIEQYYEKCAEEGTNEYQIEESQKAVSKLDVIIGDNQRLNTVADDLIAHYERRVFENATVNGKAMIVCMNREIAFNLFQKIIERRPEWAVSKKASDNVDLTELDKRKLVELPFINLVVTRGKDDKKGLYELAGTKQHRTELDRQFKNEKSNFKIAIVVDMWLTGFDVPSLDTMYIDKPLHEHTLIQTISRVNRVYPGKEKGLIVDYFGFKFHMNIALKLFNKSDSEVFEGIEEAIKIVKDELDILRRIFRNFNDKLFFKGTPIQKLECLNHASEYVQMTEELEKRFMASVKRLKSAFNLCNASDEIIQNERDYIYFYGAIRSILFKLTKGEAPDTAQMNEKVRKMIEEAILSEGVEEVFSKNKVVGSRSIDIFSDEYLEKINRIPLKNTRVKILTKLLKDAIEEYKKVNRIKGMIFSEKLKKLVDAYNDRHADKVYAEEVLDNVAEELANLLKELDNDKNSFKELGIDYEEKAFYDILVSIAKKHDFYEEYLEKEGEQRLLDLSKEMKSIVDDKSRYTDWAKKEDIKADLKVSIILKMAEYGYPPVVQDEVFKEIFLQAENFKKYL